MKVSVDLDAFPSIAVGIKGHKPSGSFASCCRKSAGREVPLSSEDMGKTRSQSALSVFSPSRIGAEIDEIVPRSHSSMGMSSFTELQNARVEAMLMKLEAMEKEKTRKSWENNKVSRGVRLRCLT
jgi:hypothetical protein